MKTHRICLILSAAALLAGSQGCSTTRTTGRGPAQANGPTVEYSQGWSPADTSFVDGASQTFPPFTWPPPKPTTFVRLPDRFGLTGGEGRTYGDLSNRLETALTGAGYGEKSFFSAPGGFALVCRLEQTDGNGLPLPPPNRWGMTTPHLNGFSLGAYIQRLLFAQPGYYRVLVFVVSSLPFGFDQDTVTREEAEEWLFVGATSLPQEVMRTSAPAGTTCVALIYQFAKNNTDAPVEFVRSETVGAMQQLRLIGLLYIP